MKLFQTVLFVSFILFGLVSASGQTTQIDLTQTKGDFATTHVDLAEGEYQFNIINQGVGADIGFVLVPEGKYDPSNHITQAYVSAPVPNNEAGLTGIVNLKPGNYEYFCPLNNTPKYTLTVHNDVQTVKLNQIAGDFIQKSLEIPAGNVQFEIFNNNVDHQVGFVLVPQGKYDPVNHIKPAYVTAPVDHGESSLTGVASLDPGVYEYFCPLNPTPKYILTVTK